MKVLSSCKIEASWVTKRKRSLTNLLHRKCHVFNPNPMLTESTTQIDMIPGGQSLIGAHVMTGPRGLMLGEDQLFQYLICRFHQQVVLQNHVLPKWHVSIFSTHLKWTFKHLRSTTLTSVYPNHVNRGRKISYSPAMSACLGLPVRQPRHKHPHALHQSSHFNS